MPHSRTRYVPPYTHGIKWLLWGKSTHPSPQLLLFHPPWQSSCNLRVGKSLVVTVHHCYLWSTDNALWPRLSQYKTASKNKEKKSTTRLGRWLYHYEACCRSKRLRFGSKLNVAWLWQPTCHSRAPKMETRDP